MDRRKRCDRLGAVRVAFARWKWKCRGQRRHRGELRSHVQALQQELNSNVIPLGRIRAGVCRHRSVLFKYLFDSVVTTDPAFASTALRCRLVRGDYGRSRAAHAWNIVRLPTGVMQIVDVMHDPTQLRDVNSTLGLNYRRLAAGGGAGAYSVVECKIAAWRISDRKSSQREAWARRRPHC